ncbi:MAG: hypothetical protein ABI200_03640, partial [Gaiellales bacterium]
MRIKTFTGRSIEELLPEIRTELGDGAVVIGQRTKVQGGVAGFFGTKVIEVTAADSMPSDDELVDLEAQLMGEGSSSGSGQSGQSGQPAAGGDDDGEQALAERFAGAMSMGRRGGLDVTDTWDPSQDAELAQEYGRVLEHAASAGFTELDVPVVPMSPTPAAAAMPAATMQATTIPTASASQTAPELDPLAQARALTEQAHRNMQQATSRMEATYAPPRPLPNAIPVEQRTSTFAASVHDTPMQSFEPEAIPHAGSAAQTVEDALRSDLGIGLPVASPTEQLQSALNDAVDILDLKAMAALRSAVHATRRSAEESVVDQRMRQAITDLESQLDPIASRLADIGVDAEVIDSIVDNAVRHRLPFGGEQNVARLMQSMIAETIDVRSGFPSLGRAHRAAIVGAANSGKTTIVAKIARGYSEIGMRVGILSIIAADPGVSLMADRSFKDLDVDVRYAATAEQAIEGVDAFDEHDLVLIDTPSGTYLDATTFAQVQSCLVAIGVDDVHVVMPLATSSREARSVMDAFRPIGANRMIVSRIDESRYFGEILNFGFRLGVPMTFLSDGPDI